MRHSLAGIGILLLAFQIGAAAGAGPSGTDPPGARPGQQAAPAPQATPAPSPTPAPPPTPAASPTPARALVIPEAAKTRKSPLPNVPEAVESGRNLYASQCAMCHGARGDGRGDLARELKMIIPDLTDPQRQKRRTDGEWFYILGHGHRDMPPEKRLVDQQKWEMILYMRTLVKAAARK